MGPEKGLGEVRLGILGLFVEISGAEGILKGLGLSSFASRSENSPRSLRISGPSLSKMMFLLFPGRSASEKTLTFGEVRYISFASTLAVKQRMELRIPMVFFRGMCFITPLKQCTIKDGPCPFC